MKKICSFITVLLLGAGAASTQSVPEFKLMFSQENLTIKKGEADSISVSVVRSKLYRRGKATFAVSSQEKKGITVKLSPIHTASDTCILKVAVSELADAGVYFVVPNCTIQGKTKGTGIKVTIN